MNYASAVGKRLGGADRNACVAADQGSAIVIDEMQGVIPREVDNLAWIAVHDALPYQRDTIGNFRNKRDRLAECDLICGCNQRNGYAAAATHTNAATANTRKIMAGCRRHYIRSTRVIQYYNSLRKVLSFRR